MDREQDGQEITVRTLMRDDLPRLVEVDKQITGRSRRAWYEGKLERALAGSDVQISLVAEREGILVGAMLATMHYGEFGLPEPIAVLDTVLVDRECSRQGIASAIFEQLLKNLRALRVERLRTEVAWDDHELVAFFCSKGFAPIPRMVLELDIDKVAP